MADGQKDEIEIVADEEESNLPDLQKKIKKLKEDLKRCETERKEYLEGWQRAKADFINYRKDEQRRFAETVQFATAGLVSEILPVLDSFDLALNYNLPPETEKGVLLIRSQLADILKKRGLEEIPIKLGEELNPEKHESIGEIESNKPAGTVAEISQKGYLFRDRVLRPAKIRIAKQGL